MSLPRFQPIDWAKLLARELVPEFRPNVAGATDTSNFDDEFTSQPAMESVAPGGALDAKKGGPNFDGFTFVAASHLK